MQHQSRLEGAGQLSEEQAEQSQAVCPAHSSARQDRASRAGNVSPGSVHGQRWNGAATKYSL